jgi:hypothetical protein
MNINGCIIIHRFIPATVSPQWLLLREAISLSLIKQKVVNESETDLKKKLENISIHSFMSRNLTM